MSGLADGALQVALHAPGGHAVALRLQDFVPLAGVYVPLDGVLGHDRHDRDGGVAHQVPVGADRARGVHQPEHVVGVRLEVELVEVVAPFVGQHVDEVGRHVPALDPDEVGLHGEVGHDHAKAMTRLDGRHQHLQRPVSRRAVFVVGVHVLPARVDEPVEGDVVGAASAVGPSAHRPPGAVPASVGAPRREPLVRGLRVEHDVVAAVLLGEVHVALARHAPVFGPHDYLQGEAIASICHQGADFLPFLGCPQQLLLVGTKDGGRLVAGVMIYDPGG